MKVLIAGGSGSLGKKVTQDLLSRGMEVAWLSRTTTRMENGVKVFYWNPAKNQIDNAALDFAEVFINLSGAGMGDARWTPARKKELVESRTVPQIFLSGKLSELQIKAKLHIAVSAVGYYGAQTQQHIFVEEDAAANDFTGTTCKAWEEASSQLNPFFERNVVLRLGVVLGKGFGALQKMELPFKWGMGAALGKGEQYFPWLHVEDFVSVFSTIILDEKYKGVYNFVAPESVSNLSFSRELAASLHRPFILPAVPGFALKMALGEMSTMLLEGSRVSSAKICEAGFRFKYPSLKEALANIYS